MPNYNKSTNFASQSFYLGLDVHKKSWTVTVRTSGLEVARFTQQPSVEDLNRYLNKRYPDADFCSAYEAGFCGTHIHEALCKVGIRNIIIHPADLPKTDKQEKNKTDLHDSRAIARYLESGLLEPIYIMPVEQQERRALCRLREITVREVTRSINRLRSFLYFFGIAVPPQFQDKNYISKKFLDWLQSVQMRTAEGTYTLQQHIDQLIDQRKKVYQITKELKQAILCNYPDQYKSLLTVPGFGPITSMVLLAETGSLCRFDERDQYTSYLGLMPAENSSGETVYSNRIQSRCNKHLRRVLIEAAWTAVRTCPAMLAYYKKHAYKNTNKAIVKVARKLALIAKAVALNHSTYCADQ